MSVHDYTLFEQRREEILDVARECFAEKGFNATTMAEVARRARMSVGNLYNYFHGKAAIIESLAEREVKKLADEVGRLGETRPSREERVAHLRQIALDAMDINLNSPVHVRRTVESVPGGVIAAPIPAMPYRDRGTPF